MSNNKVLLYGGSYNPIHKGHINAALMANNYLGCDSIWLIPRKYNYDGSFLLDSKHRVNMIKLVIKELPIFKICNIELKDENKELIYTYNTALKLTKKYKNLDFYFLIGADQLNNLPYWHEVDKLTSLLKFVCYRRPGYQINEEIAKKYNISIIEGKQIDVSSTSIRFGTFEEIDEKVINYINKHQLYLKERVMPMLSEHRFEHVLSTARLSKQIAKSLNENTNNAYVAGILHDIAKGLAKDDMIKIVAKYYPRKLKYPSYFLHAYASAYIAKTKFKITNKEILKAIENHSRPVKNMSTLEKIIYVADIVEDTRPFAYELLDIRKLAFSDIDLAFIKVLEEQIGYLKENEKEIDMNTVDMLNYYKDIYESSNYSK